MRTIRPGTPLRRILAATATAATSLSVVAGALVMAPAPAASAATRTAVPYLLFASGYATKVTAPQVGASSGPSAWTSTGCSHRVPASKSNSVTRVDTGTPLISIGAATSQVRTYRGTVGGLRSTVSRSVNDVASVAVGDPGTLQLQISGLHGVSTAWANTKGYHATSSLSLGDVDLVGPATSGLGAVGDLLNGPVKQILATLDQGPIVIPGLAKISLGDASHRVGKHRAAAATYALVIDVFAKPGQQQAANSQTDTVVTVGRSYARIIGYRYPGFFGGQAYALQATLIGGVASLGKQALLPLRCQGTHGTVVNRGLAGLNVANAGALRIGAVESDVYGLNRLRGKAQTAWTGSTVAGVALSDQLQIKAIRVRTKVWRGTDRRLHRRVVQSIGSITAGGQTYAAPAPGKSVTIPGVATLEVPKPSRTRNGVAATGLRLTLLGGTAGETVLNLANSRVSLRR